MEILTPTGYKNIEEINIGDQIVGKNGVINTLLDKRIFDQIWFEEQNLLQDWKWYLINGKYKFFRNQNIFITQGNYNLCHTFELQIGWKFEDLSGNEIEITSIEETTEESIWWKFDIDGDHSFISQDISLHNASRYWVGGGASANWGATGNTNWSATSGGSNNASVPASTDDVLFDGVGATANTNATINTTFNATNTILSFTSQVGYTATITRTAAFTVAGNVNIHKNTVWAGAAALTISAASTITATGFSAGDTFWSNNLTFSGVNTKTLVSASNDIKIAGVLTISASSATVINRTTSETLTINGLTLGSAISGTAKLIITGGNWSGGFQVANNVDLQGNVTIVTNCVYNSGTLTYVSGTITTTGSTLQLSGSCTLNTFGVTWVNLFILTTTATNIITNNSTFSCTGNLQSNVTTGSSTINGSPFVIGGNFTMNSMTTGFMAGTSNLVMNGSSPTISMTSTTTGNLRSNIEFAHTGTLTITGGTVTGTNGGFRYGPVTANSTMTITSGSISVTNRIVFVTTSTFTTTVNCNTSGITLAYIVYRSTNANFTLFFSGTNGITFGTIDLQYTGSNNPGLSLKAGNTYTVNTLFKTDISGLVASNQTAEFLIFSDTPGTKSTLTLAASASQNLYHVEFTDIDASNGQTIYTYDGLDNVLILSNVSNIRKTPTAPISTAY